MLTPQSGSPTPNFSYAAVARGAAQPSGQSNPTPTNSTSSDTSPSASHKLPGTNNSTRPSSPLAGDKPMSPTDTSERSSDKSLNTDAKLSSKDVKLTKDPKDLRDLKIRKSLTPAQAPEVNAWGVRANSLGSATTSPSVTLAGSPDNDASTLHNSDILDPVNWPTPDTLSTLESVSTDPGSNTNDNHSSNSRNNGPTKPRPGKEKWVPFAHNIVTTSKSPRNSTSSGSPGMRRSNKDRKPNQHKKFGSSSGGGSAAGMVHPSHNNLDNGHVKSSMQQNNGSASKRNSIQGRSGIPGAGLNIQVDASQSRKDNGSTVNGGVHHDPGANRVGDWHTDGGAARKYSDLGTTSQLKSGSSNPAQSTFSGHKNRRSFRHEGPLFGAAANGVHSADINTSMNGMYPVPGGAGPMSAVPPPIMYPSDLYSYAPPLAAAPGPLAMSTAMGSMPTPYHTSLSLVVGQIEYYLSIENLCKDIFLRRLMNSHGFIPLRSLSQFNRIKALTNNDYEFFLEACRWVQSAEVLGSKIRLRHGWDKWVLNEKDRLPEGKDDYDSNFKFHAASAVPFFPKQQQQQQQQQDGGEAGDEKKVEVKMDKK